MDVKSAVEKAVSHIKILFEHEGLTNIGLEEAYLASDESDDFTPYWIITVGFSRPWDYPAPNALSELAGKARLPKRSFKIVRINDVSGDVVSVRNWTAPSDDTVF